MILLRKVQNKYPEMILLHKKGGGGVPWRISCAKRSPRADAILGGNAVRFAGGYP